MSDNVTYWPAAQVKKSHRTSKSLRSGSSSISSMRMPTSSSVRARLSPCQLPSFKLSRWLRSNRAGAKNVEVEKYIKNNQCLWMYYMLTTLKTYFFSEFHINFLSFKWIYSAVQLIGSLSVWPKVQVASPTLVGASVPNGTPARCRDHSNLTFLPFTFCHIFIGSVDIVQPRRSNSKLFYKRQIGSF